MATFDIKAQFENKLNELWDEATKNFILEPLHSSIARGYAIESEIEKNSILFVSMNPSFVDGKWNNGNQGGNVFYKIPALFDPKGTNNFFNAINLFYNDIKDSREQFPRLAHHDLLFIRETKQENVLNWKKKYNSFFKEQLDISKRIIIESEPKLIVVLNAGARELFKEMFGELSIENTLGVRIYPLNDMKTPVLFSGMLSGGHPLDLGSKESLQWHIQFILDNLKYNK